MRPDRMTTKSHEAFQEASQRASRFGNPELQPEHLLAAMLEQEGGVAAPLLQKAGADVAALRDAVARKVEGFPQVSGGAEPGLSRRTLEIIRRAEDEAKALKDDFVSVEHYVLGMAKHDREMMSLFEQHGGHQLREAPLGARERPRQPAHHGSRSRREVPGAREVHAATSPTAARQGKDRPGHRSRRGDPARHAGPLAAHEEQPGPHRRARRRQDGDRRGDRPAHRAGRRPGVAEEQAALFARHGRARRRREVPWRVRGPAQGRAQGGRGLARAEHPLHRRAAHDRRRRRGRGLDGRGESPEAGARARGAAVHRRDDARRVPEAHREGRRARAAISAGLRVAADRGGHDRDPPRTEGALRGPPRDPHPGRGARRGGDAERPLRHRPLPAGQGDRSRRRSGGEDQDGSRQHAGGDRRRVAQADAASDRRAGAQEGARSGEQGAPRGRQASDRRARGGIARHARAVAAREGDHRADPEVAARDRAAPSRGRSGAAPRRSRARGGDQLRHDPGAREEDRGVAQAAREGAGEDELPARGGHRPGHRRDRLEVDGHPRHQDDARARCTSSSTWRTS